MKLLKWMFVLVLISLIPYLTAFRPNDAPTGMWRKIFCGFGSPEGSLNAPPGSLYLRRDEGSGPALWVKRSGRRATGWNDMASLEMVNARDYGAVGDGLADDTAALQAALQAGGIFKPVFIPSGTYKVSAPLDISFKGVFGVHHWRSTEGGTVIKASDEASLPYVLFSQNNPCQLENIMIDGGGRSDYGLHTFKAHGSTTLIRNVSVWGATTAGFYFKQSQVANFDALIAQNNTGDGFVIEDCNASKFFNLQSRSNGGIGVVVLAVENSAGVYMINGNIELNGSHAIVIRGTSSTSTVENYWIENDQDGIHIDGAHLVNVRNCRISGMGIGTNRAIRLTGTSGDCVIDGNSAARSGGDVSYAAVEVELGSANNVITGNSRLFPYGVLPVNTQAPQRMVY